VQGIALSLIKVYFCYFPLLLKTQTSQKLLAVPGILTGFIKFWCPYGDSNQYSCLNICFLKVSRLSWCSYGAAEKEIMDLMDAMDEIHPVL